MTDIAHANASQTPTSISNIMLLNAQTHYTPDISSCQHLITSKLNLQQKKRIWSI